MFPTYHSVYSFHPHSHSPLFTLYESSGSLGGKYEDDSFLEYGAV
jgi:hypothetical protein